MGSVNCSDITYASCPPPAYLDYKSEDITIEDYYVAYSIYSLWQFFNSYYLAMGNANTLASENIASIVDLLDPIKKSGSSMNDVFQALSSGLAFATPFLGTVGAGIATGINQIPVLGNYLFPQQTLDTQFQQFGTLSGSLGDVTLQIQKNIAATLHEIEANFDFFLAFAGDGGFSVATIPSMHDQSTNMLSTFNAFVVAQALKANSWKIARAVDTDVHALMTNGTLNAWSITACKADYDAKGICGPYYFNKQKGISYTLYGEDRSHKNPQELFGQIFEKWTTPELLFDNAQACKDAGGTAPTVSFDPTGRFNFGCFSAVDICTWNQNPAVRNAEFSDCPDQESWLGSSWAYTSDTCVYVPWSYVGPLMTHRVMRQGRIVGWCAQDAEASPQYPS